MFWTAHDTVSMASMTPPPEQNWLPTLVTKAEFVALASFAEEVGSCENSDSTSSFVLEAGASAKEGQALARHSTVEMTMNVYAKTRSDRLAEIAEKVGESVLGE